MTDEGGSSGPEAIAEASKKSGIRSEMLQPKVVFFGETVREMNKRNQKNTGHILGFHPACILYL